jgi:hypothetical protein
MRIPPAACHEVVKMILRNIAELECPRWTSNGLLTDLAVDQQGRADLTPFNAPSGNRTFRPSYLQDQVWSRS